MSDLNARRANLLHQVACVFACLVVALFAFAVVPARAIAEEEEPALVAAASEKEEAAEAEEAEVVAEPVASEEPELVAAAPTAEEAEPVAAESEEEIELVAAAPEKRNTWYDDGTGWSYYDSNGNKVYGFAQIGGYWYFLDKATGYLIEGKTFTDSGKQYVSNDEGICTTNEWVKLGSDWYRTGSEHGQMITGWAQVGGKWYFMDSNGICLIDQLFSTNGKYYIADANGACYLNQWVKLGSTWYYATGDCSLQTGWLYYGKTWYYLDPDASGAMLADTTKTINGKDYSFDTSGALVTGWVLKSGVWWYYDPDSGAEVNGWVKYKNEWYYIDETSGMMDDAIFNDNGTLYIAKPGGICPDNEWVSKGGYWYYTNANCSIASGWLLWKDNWYYLDTDSDPANFGKMKAATMFNDGYKDYLAANNGICPSNKWVSFGGDWYYCGGSCALYTGWLHDDDGYWYYLDTSNYKMLHDTTTPDGYKVDSHGRWVQS